MSNQSTTKKCNFRHNQVKTTTEKFVWMIDNFSERPFSGGPVLPSEFISTTPNGQTLKWRIAIYPNGYSEECKDYVSLYLKLIDSNNEEVKAKYEISLRKSNGEEFILKPMSEKYLKLDHLEIENLVDKKLIKREDLLNEENGYLDSDRLTLIFKLIFRHASTEKAPLPDVEVPEPRAVEDMSRLFEESLFTDCKIISGDKKEFEVHKCILGCRSPVFEAMFQHKTTAESINNEVTIPDIRGDVIEKMLRFIYSGKEPDFGKMAEELLIAAQKYELIRLKLLCERTLINSMGTANVCRLLVLANDHSADNLKAQAINFIKIRGNEVMESEDWKNLVDVELMEQVLKAVLTKQT